MKKYLLTGAISGLVIGFSHLAPEFEIFRYRLTYDTREQLSRVIFTIGIVIAAGLLIRLLGYDKYTSIAKRAGGGAIFVAIGFINYYIGLLLPLLLGLAHIHLFF